MPERQEQQGVENQPASRTDFSRSANLPQQHRAQQHAENLKASRASSLQNRKGNVGKNIQMAKNAAAGFSLMKHIDPFMDWLFGIALAFAILKDVLDILNTALIAAGGVGWFLIMLFTGACSLAIFFIMLITGASGKVGMAKGIAKRIVALFVATGAEMIPGIGLLPMESIVVMVIFWMTLAERKTGAQLENPQISMGAESQIA